MCRTDCSNTPPTVPVRIPRPLRDFLQASPDGIQAACRRAWTAARDAPSSDEWIDVDAAGLLAGAQVEGVERIQLRSRGNQLHVILTYRTVTAVAIGRRLIVVVESAPLPEVMAAALVNRSFSAFLRAPCLEDPALIVQRVIQRAGGSAIDLRCRCPSHLVDIT